LKIHRVVEFYIIFKMYFNKNIWDLCAILILFENLYFVLISLLNQAYALGLLNKVNRYGINFRVLNESETIYTN
jgi:hypothetical protein